MQTPVPDNGNHMAASSANSYCALGDFKCRKQGAVLAEGGWLGGWLGGGPWNAAFSSHLGSSGEGEEEWEGLGCGVQELG